MQPAEASLPGSSHDLPPWYDLLRRQDIGATAILTVLMASIYFVTGKVGFLMAIPPGNVTILWPPSGLALAALAVLGPRMLPGIFLGAFLVNIAGFTDNFAGGLTIAEFLVGLSIALGSVLQPVAGWWLLRRFGDINSPLSSLRNSLIFFALAPVFCLISSGIGAFSLVFGDLLPGTEQAWVMAYWWGGDTIGVWIFAPLALVAMRLGWQRFSMLLGIFALGLYATWFASVSARQDEKLAWESLTRQVSERLTANILNGLELSYSSMQAMALIFSPERVPTETDFFDAAFRLQDAQSDSFPTFVAWAQPDAEGNWRMAMSTSDDPLFGFGASISAAAPGYETIKVAQANPDILVMGEVLRIEGGGQSILVGLSAETANGVAVLLGAINVSDIVDGLIGLHGDDFYRLRLRATLSGQTDFDRVLGTLVAPTGASNSWESETRSADAHMLFTWDIMAGASGGVQDGLAVSILVGGTAATVLLAIVVSFLFVQNHAIKESVRQRTAEVVSKTDLLQAVMGSMSQGIAAFDKDLILIASNKRFQELRGYPDEIIFEGQTFEALMRYDAVRGEFGDGNFEIVVQEQVARAARFQHHHFERRRPNGDYLEISGGPLPGGGFVSTYTDITDRRQTEEKLSAQFEELNQSRRATLNMMSDLKSTQQAAEQARQSAEASEQVLQLAMDNMSDGIVMVDEDQNFALFNKRYLEYTCLPEDLVKKGAPIATAIATHIDRQDFNMPMSETFLQDRLAAMASDTVERASMKIQETGRYLEIRKSPVQGGGAVLILTDVTDETLARAQLTDALEVISESIEYAAGIQQSVLPAANVMAALVPDHMVIWQPRDVVGGDVYWVREWGWGTLVVLGDCTGHGVPGAFMSLIATGALNRALDRVAAGELGGLLAEMNRHIQRALGQDQASGSSDDGLELGAVWFDKKGNAMNFAGARFSLFICDQEQVTEVKGTKCGIGYREIDREQLYRTERLTRIAGNRYFLASDGITDQIGGPRRRGFGKNRMKQLFIDTRDKDFAAAKADILSALIDWQGDEKRRDDVSMIGFRADPVE